MTYEQAFYASAGSLLMLSIVSVALGLVWLLNIDGSREQIKKEW